MNTPTSITVKKPSAFKKHFEFYQGEDQLIATLEYETWKERAILQIGTDKWELKRTGFWNPFLEIKPSQSPYNIQKIKLPWNHKLEVSGDDGNVYRFKKKNWYGSSWLWVDRKDVPVISMSSKSYSRKQRGSITIEKEPAQDFYLLLIIGWFTIIRSEAHAAAVI